jgi:GT2 family glycosyltransferase
MELSIILVNYKTPALTVHCINSILVHSINATYEIIVVDNQSEDDSEEIITAKFPNVIWVNMGYNSGFSRGNNEGVRHAKGKYLLFLNTDTLVHSNTISESLNRLKNNDSISGISVNMTDAEGKTHIVDENFNIQGLLQYSYIPSENFLMKAWTGLFSKTLKKKLNNQSIDFLVGAFLMCRKEDFEKVGGFNPQLFLYGEDIDLSCKLAQLGSLVKYEDLEIVHLEGGSTSKAQSVQTFFSLSPQMQLSNLVWIRNWYGTFPLFSIMLNYWIFAPFYLVLRALKGVFGNNTISEEIKAPLLFLKQLKIWTSYFPSIIFKKEAFYKYVK